MRPPHAVWMWNTGPGAYLPELFGECIEIQRIIKATGSGGVNAVLLRNTAGAVVRKGAKSLDELLDYMGVDASNPVNVLTQDAARSFLR